MIQTTQQVKDQILERFLSQAAAIDTESTGIDAKTAEICEIGYAITDGPGKCRTQSELFGTKELIPFAASSKNNISRSMLAGLPTIQDKIELAADLVFLRENNIQYIAAHNYKYDITILTSSFDRMGFTDLTKKVNNKKWICTYRVAQQLFKPNAENKDFSYNLSFLRYAFDLPVGNLAVHRAGDDAAVCWHLLRYMGQYVLDNLMDGDSLDPDFDLGEFLHGLTVEPIEFTTFPFGKHKGEDLKDVPMSYYNWLLKNSDMINIDSPGYDPDFAASIEKELNRRMGN